MRPRIKIGQRVRVPRGVGSVEGVVLDIYGTKEQRYVLVRVPILGPAGETLAEETTNVLLEWLEPIEATSG